MQYPHTVPYDICINHSSDPPPRPLFTAISMIFMLLQFPSFAYTTSIPRKNITERPKLTQQHKFPPRYIYVLARSRTSAARGQHRPPAEAQAPAGGIPTMRSTGTTYALYTDIAAMSPTGQYAMYLYVQTQRQINSTQQWPQFPTGLGTLDDLYMCCNKLKVLPVLPKMAGHLCRRVLKESGL